MPIVVFVFIALVLLGIGLIAWAWLNPKWQCAEAFDSVLPFIAGMYCLIGAVILAVGAGIIWFIRWF